jgi:hypothetical protein
MFDEIELTLGTMATSGEMRPLGLAYSGHGDRELPASEWIELAGRWEAGCGGAPSRAMRKPPVSSRSRTPRFYAYARLGLR